ncbi:hypothetical protein GCM10028798_07480 [Humibacter antri]
MALLPDRKEPGRSRDAHEGTCVHSRLGLPARRGDRHGMRWDADAERLQLIVRDGTTAYDTTSGSIGVSSASFALRPSPDDFPVSRRPIQGSTYSR